MTTTTPKLTSLNDLADVAIKRAKADVDFACEFLLDECLNDAEQMQRFAEKGIRETVLLRIRSQRDAALNTPADLKRDPNRMVALANSYIRSAMDYTLSRSAGIRLAEATHSQIKAEAEMHWQFANGNRHKAIWFERIAEAIPADDTEVVANVLDEETLQSWWKASI